MPERQQERQENLVYGMVEEALPNALFRVVLEENKELVLAYLAGKMRKFRIRVLVGDRVALVTDPYGGKARIVKRMYTQGVFKLRQTTRVMKIRSSIKKRSPEDQIVRRRGKIYVINKKKPRNKQRQG